MPCVPRARQPHRQKLVAGYPLVPCDVAMSNVGCKEVVTPAYVHRLLDRSEWKDRAEVLDAINSEKQGLLANGTGDESKIRPKAEVLAEARAKGQKIHVGALMVLVSIKGFEKSPAEWIIEARIVFRVSRRCSTCLEETTFLMVKGDSHLTLQTLRNNVLSSMSNFLERRSNSFADSGSLVETDDECVGQLSASAAKLVMKLMWLCRISRPDIMVAINTLARHITRWSANGDKRAARLVGYMSATIDYAHIMRVNDPPTKLWLSLYFDSDFGSSADMKSTSGFVLALEGPDSLAILFWGSKTQRAVSRSTTEAEFVALSTALFGEAVSLLAVCQRLVCQSIVLKCFEDNQAVLAIIAKGYSPKLKHLAKFHRIHVASTCEAFSSEDILIEYTETRHQKADVMNKALPVSIWSNAVTLLLCIKFVAASFTCIRSWIRPIYGYFSLESDPIGMFKCLSTVQCPGGEPNNCGGGREGVPCGECPARTYWAGSICRRCSAWSVIGWISCLILIFVGLVLAYYFLNSPMTAKASTLVSTTCAVGMMINMLQSLGIVGTMTVEWPVNINGILSWLQVFTFDIDGFAFSCLAGENAVARYIGLVLFFPAALLWLQFCGLISKVNRKRAWDKVKLRSTMGQFLQVAFSTMSSTALVPMICYAHPNGLRSKLKYPNVLCGSNEHTAMVIAGSLLLVLGLCGFWAFAWLAYMCPKFSALGRYDLVQSVDPNLTPGNYVPDFCWDASDLLGWGSDNAILAQGWLKVATLT
eukprot:s690_g30.t1